MPMEIRSQGSAPRPGMLDLLSPKASPQSVAIEVRCEPRPSAHEQRRVADFDRLQKAEGAATKILKPSAGEQLGWLAVKRGWVDGVSCRWDCDWVGFGWSEP